MTALTDADFRTWARTAFRQFAETLPVFIQLIDETQNRLADANARETELRKEVERLKDIEGLYGALEHGNDEHRKWLRSALLAWSRNERPPAPYGAGRAEAAERRAQEAEAEAKNLRAHLAVARGKTFAWSEYTKGPHPDYGPCDAFAPGGACAECGKLRRQAEDARDERQRTVGEWCAAAFGHAHASNLAQRALRLLEEAIETFQAAGGNRSMAYRLTDFVFDRPRGDLSQEIGGVGITLLALANAARLSADQAEAAELDRILAKPLEHFTARNEAKNAAGFEIPEVRGGDPEGGSS